MGKAGKSTKKFQKKHLKKTLDQRKVEHQYKKKVAGDKRDKYFKDKKSKSEPSQTTQPEQDEIFDNESVDKFLENDVMDDIRKLEKKKASKPAKSQKDQAKSHKQELEDLAENDPEFYKYLKENDKALLSFDPERFVSDEEEDEEEEDEQEDDEEEISEDERPKQPRKTFESITVTDKEINAWNDELKKHSVSALKSLAQAFSNAVQATTHGGAGEDEINAKGYKYTVTDPKAFSSLVILGISKIAEEVQYHVPLKRVGKNNKSVISEKEEKKLKGFTGTLKSYFSALNILIKDGKQSKVTVSLILVAADSMLPYLMSYRNIVKEFIRNVCHVWAESEGDEIKLAAFSFLKRAAELYQKSLLEMILKNMYSELVKVSRRTTVHTMPSINLLKNSAAALYTLDPNLSYQLSFQFVRQLALHLRNSIVNKTAESYKAVYNWQYVHSLDFWIRVLCANSESSNNNNNSTNPMMELIHPVVQVTLGTMRLIPTAQYFPLRFSLIRSLLQLSQKTGVYIPLLPALTEILVSSAITKSGKPSTQKPLDFEHNIKASKSLLGTRVYQDGICEQFVDLVGEFFVLHCKSIAFPELAIPALINLKRFTKRTKNVKFSKQIQRLLERIEQNSSFIVQQRNKVTFGPLDKELVNNFLKDYEWEKTPLGTFVVVQREVREERLRMLRESLEESDNEHTKDELGLNGIEEEADEDSSGSESGDSEEELGEEEDEEEMEVDEEEEEQEDE